MALSVEQAQVVAAAQILLAGESAKLMTVEESITMPKYPIKYPAYSKQEFPKVLYHKTKDPVTAKTAEDAAWLEEEFPGEWKESPAAHGKPETAPSLAQQEIHSFESLKAKKLKENKSQEEKKKLGLK